MRSEGFAGVGQGTVDPRQVNGAQAETRTAEAPGKAALKLAIEQLKRILPGHGHFLLRSMGRWGGRTLRHTNVTRERHGHGALQAPPTMYCMRAAFVTSLDIFVTFLDTHNDVDHVRNVFGQT